MPHTSAKPVLSADTCKDNKVVDPRGEDLGKIEDLMIDTGDGSVAYAVLSFGGFMGVGNKLFAIPWSSLRIDTENERFILDADKSKLENAPGFDKDNWPDMADPTFRSDIYSYYGATPRHV